MIWTQQKLDELPVINHFYFRGENTTRLETFTDAAFAFAITMLVISVGDIPSTYSELISALKGIPSFLASFAAISLFWIAHREWSRRYGLEDTKSIILSFGLIFVMLVYVFPLRLLFSLLFHWISFGWLPSEFALQNYKELISLFIIYGIGLAAMSILVALLFYHAKSKKELLLTEIEIILTTSEIMIWLVMAACGILSALIAWLMPPQIGSFAGFAYTLLPFIIPFIAKKYRRQVSKIKSS